MLNGHIYLCSVWAVNLGCFSIVFAAQLISLVTEKST